MALTANNKRHLLRRFVTTYRPADFFRRYELFKFLTLIFLLGIFTSITISAFQMHMLSTIFGVEDFFTLYVTKFLPRFWLFYNKWNLFTVLLVFCFFRFSWFKGFFLNRIEFIIPPKLLDPYIARRFAVVNNILAWLLLVYMVLVAFPVLHLYNLNMYTVLTALVTLVLSFLYNNYLKLSKTGDDYLKPVSKLAFLHTSYKSASGAPISEELKEEIKKYREVKDKSLIGGDLIEFAAKSDENKFKGSLDLFKQLELLFDSEGNNSGTLINKIYLHNKTSDAVVNAVELVHNYSKNEVSASNAARHAEDGPHTRGYQAPAPETTVAVIYSDAEFLHVRKALDKYNQIKHYDEDGNAYSPGIIKQQQMNLFAKRAPDYKETEFQMISADSMIETEKYVLEDSISEEYFANDRIQKICDMLFYEPRKKTFCIVMSHVFYQTGRVLQVKSITERIRKQLEDFNKAASFALRKNLTDTVKNKLAAKTGLDANDKEVFDTELRNFCREFNYKSFKAGKYETDGQPVITDFKAVFILDGAQALGNIRITDGVTRVCHF